MKSKNLTILIMIGAAAIVRALFVSQYLDRSGWNFINGIVLGFVIITFAYILEEGSNLDTWSYSALLFTIVTTIGHLLLSILHYIEFDMLTFVQFSNIFQGIFWDQLVARILQPINASNLVEYVTLTTIAVLLIRSPDLNKPRINKPHSSKIAYEEPELNPKFTQVTRLLTATLVLDTQFREMVLDFVKNKHIAFAPELGIDIGKLARISFLLNSRQQKYNFIYLVISMLSFILFQFDYSLTLVFLLLSSIIVTAYYHYERDFRLLPLVTKRGYGPDRLERALKSNHKLKYDISNLPGVNQNILVYGDFIPFVGAGFRIDDTEGWSFPINICHPKEPLSIAQPIKSFELKDIYDAIVQSMDRCRFKGFLARDFLFVNGTQIRQIPWILPDDSSSPTTQVGNDHIAHYINRNDQTIRYYKWLQFYDWSNELVVSYIFRVMVNTQLMTLKLYSCR
ncbi:MAG: hypothetical protein H6658_11395 [Ardenticatenaceae bacterium]|nr:hypothetical protein [Ardenticatenaceae bacterium]